MIHSTSLQVYEDMLSQQLFGADIKTIGKDTSFEYSAPPALVVDLLFSAFASQVSNLCKIERLLASVDRYLHRRIIFRNMTGNFNDKRTQ